MNEQLQKQIENILSQSDIVWGKYGSDTIQNLAARTIRAVEEKK